MATKLLKFMTIFSLILTIQSQITFSSAMEENDEEAYILDAPFANTRLRSRFLASIKKGTHCNIKGHNVCNGFPANKGASLLYCCKKHCRDVLSDENNCGQCGSKCRFGERCCRGRCLNVFYNNDNCGKCNKKCSVGKTCDYGHCGYA